MSDEKILSQLNSDGNIIGYQPTLKYEKQRTAIGKAITSQEDINYDPEKDTTLYSRTLNGFAENTPSNVLSDISNVLKNINRLKSNLAQKFNEDQAVFLNPFYKSDSNISDTEIILNNARPGTSYNPYNDINKLVEAENTGNESFSNEFEERYNSLYGSVIPSLLNKLTFIENKLSVLNTVFKQIYYNNPNISLKEARNYDISYVSDMKLRERQGKNTGINYLTLSFDGILNKTVSMCTYQDNKSAIKVTKVIDSHDESQATVNDMDIVKKLFDDIEKQLDLRSRGYMRNENLELIQKSMYNYYEKRKQLNDLYTLYRQNPNSKLLARKTQEYSNELNNAIKNVAKVLLYNQNYLEKVTILEKQKYDLQKLFRSTSSNS